MIPVLGLAFAAISVLVTALALRFYREEAAENRRLGALIAEFRDDYTAGADSGRYQFEAATIDASPGGKVRLTVSNVRQQVTVLMSYREAHHLSEKLDICAIRLVPRTGAHRGDPVPPILESGRARAS